MAIEKIGAMKIDLNGDGRLDKIELSVISSTGNNHLDISKVEINQESGYQELLSHWRVFREGRKSKINSLQVKNKSYALGQKVNIHPEDKWLIKGFYYFLQPKKVEALNNITDKQCITLELSLRAQLQNKELPEYVIETTKIPVCFEKKGEYIRLVP